MGAIPESLFESELFGHKKGAFTDAKADRMGRFELAEGGTLFLDEIANLTMDQQAKLLRVLEEGEFEMVGDSTTKIANVRLICATNANLEQMINDGRFRADLYFRLNTIHLTVPSLKDRREDIAPLLQYFLDANALKYAKSPMKFSTDALNVLKHYDWPGNIRELSHLVERCVLLAESEMIDITDIDLPSSIVNSAQHSQGMLPLIPIEEAEQQLIKMALKKTMGNIIESAKLLGISQSSMYRRMEKFGINKFELAK
jgi:DNA-binding NtrC family response regulator